MGWGSGSDVFESIWSPLREEIPEEKRINICALVIYALQSKDWDCECDFIGDKRFPEFKQALNIADKKWILKNSPCPTCELNEVNCNCWVCRDCGNIFKNVCNKCGFCQKCCKNYCD